MKITIEHFGEIVSKEMPEGATVAKFLQTVAALMIVVGYHPESIKEYFVDEQSPLEWDTE